MGSTSSTTLYPAISLINHAAQPNCTQVGRNPPGSNMGRKLGYPRLLAVGALHSLRKGQEITIQYMPDEAAVQKKWGTGA